MPRATSGLKQANSARALRADQAPSGGAGAEAQVCDELLVHTFGVGHGDCTLLEAKQNKRVSFRLLCDAGADLPHALVDFLKKNRREASNNDIDIAILSHVDSDHQGGFHDLFQDHSISIGEFWGPCLPAFRRLKWLFAPRVERAVERASKLENALAGRKVPVIYPMEHYTQTAAAGMVTLSVISPAPRLIRRLLSASGEGLSDLLTSSPLPLEWLIAQSSDAEESDNQADMQALFEGRSFLSPHDFGPNVPNARADRELLFNAAAERAGAAWEPNFFGNSVLNDTSLVVVVDVLLDGRHRRRVLLSGDQENWNYIAAKHPAGLGVDVLKVPHHGGRVYLGDKREAMEQMYLWLRPRIAVVSARGHHNLPRIQWRNAIRAVGATLLCPNARGMEPITAASGLDNHRSCFDSYQCKSSSQREVTTLRLTGATESSDAPACVQGTAHRGVAPIVVLEQRLIEPDEAFVRWTRMEIERQARWIRGKLDVRHEQFKDAATKAKEPCFAAMRASAMPWKQLEAMARADGNHPLVADPEPVVKLAVSRQIAWVTSESRFGANSFCRPVGEVEYTKVLRWLAAMPHIILSIPRYDTLQAEGGDKLGLLDATDTYGLSCLIAGRLFTPLEFVEREIFPRLKVDLLSKFSARACRADDPERWLDSNGASALLHLYHHETAVPDVFSDEWKDKLWNGRDLNEEKLKFVLKRAGDSVLVPISESKHATNGFNVLPEEFKGFLRQYSHDWNVRHVKGGAFPVAFAKACWTGLWNADQRISNSRLT